MFVCTDGSDQIKLDKDRKALLQRKAEGHKAKVSSAGKDVEMKDA